MTLLVCAATTTEANAVMKAVRLAGRSHQIQVLKTGIGAERAKEALEREMARRSRLPELVVSTGFAGSGSRDFPLRSWVYDNSPQAVAPPDRWLSVLKAAGTQINLLNEVETHWSQNGCEGVVDMESRAISEVCAKYKLPFCAIRLISDTPEFPLPHFVADWVKALNDRKIAGKVAGCLRASQATLVYTLFNPAKMVGFLSRGNAARSTLQTAWLELARDIS